MPEAKKAVSVTYKPKIFASLITEVIKPGKCVGCGACVAVCPPGVIKFKEVPGRDEEPSLTGKCLLCEFCYYQCPMTPSGEELETLIFGRSSGEKEPLGIFMKAYSARAMKDEILRVASDGGAVTGMLAYGLNEGILQAATLAGVRRDMPWKPEPKLALTIEDLLGAAGTKYSVAPTVLALAEAVDSYELERIASVGTPCQIKAVRKMQYGVHGAIKYGGRVKLTIGLFCSENFYYDKLIKEFVASRTELSKITKFNIRSGMFIAEAEGGRVLEVKIKEVKSYARTNCEYCTDFTANLADISVGNVGSPEGWSTVIVRTEAGMRFLEGAIEKGWIEVKPLEIKPDGILMKLASKKRGRGGKVQADSSEK